VNSQALTPEVCNKAMGMHHEVVNTFFKGHDQNVLQNYCGHRRRIEEEEWRRLEEEERRELEELNEMEWAGRPSRESFVDWGPEYEEPVGPEVMELRAKQEFIDRADPLSPVVETQCGSREFQWKPWKPGISVETRTTAFGDEPLSPCRASVSRHSAFDSIDCWEEEEEEYEREATGFTPPPNLFLSKVAPLRKQDMAQDPLSPEDLSKVKSQAETLRNLKPALGGTGDTALTLAARHGHYAVCELLLVYQADVNLKDKSGDTAVEISAREGHHEVCKVLMQGCPSEEVHQSALKLARAYGKEGTTAVLRGYEVLAA